MTIKRVFLIFFLIFPGFIISASADFISDPNNGFYSVDFQNTPVGLAPNGAPFRENVILDHGSGTATLSGASGYITTGQIIPSSFESWTEVEVSGTWNKSADVQVQVVGCDGSQSPLVSPTVLFGPSSLVGGKVDISALSTANDCIQIQVLLNDDDGILPVISEVKASWDPLPVFLLRLRGDSESLVGDIVTYKVDFSVSYVDSDGVVIYVPLPNAPGDFSDFTAGYNQSADPGFELSFDDATSGGSYTASSIDVNGITIPANSVYWNLGDVVAGKAGTLAFSLLSNNGLEDGIQFPLQARMDSLDADLALSDGDAGTAGAQEHITTLISEPAPAIDKKIAGTVFVNNTNVVHNDNGFGSTVTYSITFANSNAPKGREEIFNPIITDDLSDIYAKLMDSSPAGCDVATKGDVTALISVNDGGVLNETNEEIIWDYTGENMASGESRTVSFTVDYSPCFSGPGAAKIPDEIITNYAHFDADNISRLSDEVPIGFKLDLTPYGIFQKGERAKGVNSLAALRDDHADYLHTFNETATYLLRAVNTSLIRFDDVVMVDKVPAGTEFLSASIPAVYAGSEIYYREDEAATDPSTPPVFDYTDPLGTGWTLYDPSSGFPADPSLVTWVAYYVPCLSSPVFPSPGGSECDGIPSDVMVTMNTRILTPGEVGFPGTGTPPACSMYDINNVGNFFIYSASNSINNADPDVVVLGSPVSAVDPVEPTHISPLVPALDNYQATKISGDTLANAGDIVSYSITVYNDGRDTSRNTEVEIVSPELSVNGVVEKLSLSGASGGVVDYSDLPNSITINVGDIPAKTSKTVTISYLVPKGGVGSFTVNARITGEDDEACAEATAVLSKSTEVTGEPFLRVVKSRDESLIGSGEDIHYQLTFTNIGNIPTSQTYVVDRVPERATLVEVYTSPATDDNANTFDCAGCTVSFAKPSGDLPSELDPLDALTVADINAFFVPGVETSPGVWIPDPGYAAPEEVLFIAWHVDYPGGVFPVDAVGRVGLTVTNDDDGLGGSTAGSLEGTLIRNSGATVSDELLQAIGNQVITTILDNPGLNLNKTVEKDFVGAGEEFSWYIDYKNDSTADNTGTVITDTLPLGLTLVSVFHEWNGTAVLNGLAAGEVDITSNASVKLTANLDGTTDIEVTIADTDDSPTAGLRGADLQANEGGRIRIVAKVASDAVTDTIYNNTVQGCYENATADYCIYDNAITTVANPDLYLRKLVDQPKPAPGDIVNYTLILSNEGKLDAPSVTIVDTLAAGLCFQSVTVLTPDWTLPAPVISGGPCATTSTTLTFTGIKRSDLASGVVPGNSENIYIQYSVAVDASVGNGVTLNNTATVTTSLPEDPDYPNEEPKDVLTPLPDPYVTKDGADEVNPGDAFSYVLEYGNLTKVPGTNVYLRDTLPDFDSDGTADITVTGFSVSSGEAVYCHNAALNIAPPVFNPASPTDNGWVDSATCLGGGYTPTQVVFLVGTLAANSGPFTIGIDAQATDPDTTSNLPAGTLFTNAVVINSDQDENMVNNSDSHDTTTPGFDLYLKKTGSIEGVFPGTVPGADLTYTIEFGNKGTDAGCDVHIEDPLPGEVILASTPHNFTILTLFDSDGNEVKPLDTFGAEILSPVPVVFSQSGSTLRWELGSPKSGVCLPGKSHGSFEVYVRLNSGLADSTSVINSATIYEDSAGIEDRTDNNSDDSLVAVYRADLRLSKSGVSCGADDNCTTLVAEDSTHADLGDYIQYTLEYNNIGNTAAENAEIIDAIPAGTCYRVGTVEADLPAGSSVEYSNDNAISWTYSPAASGVDCNVTHFRIVFAAPLPAPATFDAEGTVADFAPNITLASGVQTDAVKQAIRLEKTPYYQLAETRYGTDGQLYGGVMPWPALTSSDIELIPDLNGDGIDEVYISGNGASLLHYSGEEGYVHGGSGSDAISALTGRRVESIALIEDQNNDGIPEILSAIRGGNIGGEQLSITVSDYLDPANTFPVDSALGILLFSVEVVPDQDGDGYQDIVVHGSTTTAELILSDHGSSVGTCNAGPCGPFYGANALSVNQINIATIPSGQLRKTIVVNNGDDAFDDLLLTSSGTNYILQSDGVAAFGGGAGSLIALPGGSRNTNSASLIEDLNGDGLPEILIANRLAANQIVFSDNINNNYTGPNAIAVDLNLPANHVGDIGTIDDMNGDGIPEIILAYGTPYNADGTAASLENYILFSDTGDPNGYALSGGGTAIALAGGPMISSEIKVIADQNSDGFPDLLFSSAGATGAYYPSYVVISEPGVGYLNGGTYYPLHRSDAFGYLQSKPLLVPDQNGDGIEDLFVPYTAPVSNGFGPAIITSEPMIGFSNGGDSVFATTVFNSTILDAVLLPDMNADGMKEIYYAGTVNSGLMLSGSGSLLAPDVTRIDPSNNDANYDKDGIYDLAISDDTDGDSDYETYIFHAAVNGVGGSAGSFVAIPDPVTGFSVPSSVSGVSLLGNTGRDVGVITIDDQNSDGVEDLVILSDNTTNARVILSDGASDPWGSGGQSFVNIPGSNLAMSDLVYGEDYNGDGHRDILSVGNNGQLYVMLSAADGFLTGGSSTVLVVDVPGVGFIEDLTLVTDRNGDGFKDIILEPRNGTLDTLLVLSNGIDGFVSGASSTLALSGTAYASYGSIEIPDENGDGVPEIIRGNHTSFNLQLLLSTEANVLSGTYETVAESTGTLISWDRLLLDYEIPEGTSITLTVGSYDGVSCDYTSPLFGPESIDQNFYGVSGIDPSNTEVCLKFDLSSDDELKTPYLKYWALTYSTDEQPSVTYEVWVEDEGQTESLILNTAGIETTTPELRYDNNNDDYSHILNQSELELTKSVDLAAASAGDPINYTLEYCNNGPRTAENAVITDTLPRISGLTVVVAGGLPGGCSESSGVVTCNLGNLAVGVCGSVVIPVTIDGAVPANSTLLNSACIESDTFDSLLTNNCDTAATVTANLANVYIEKSGPVVAHLGSELTYTLKYGNNGNVDALDTVLTDTFLETTQLDSGFTPVFNYNAGVINSCSLDYGSGIVSCAAVTLPAGGSGEINVTVKVANDTDLLVNASEIENLATIVTSTLEVTENDNADDWTVPVKSRGLSDLGGKVFRDRDEDVEFDGDDQGIAGVSVYMYGYDIFGNVFGPDPSDPLFTPLMSEILGDLQANVDPGLTLANLSSYAKYQITAADVTGSDGSFVFNSLNIGVYNLAEVQPEGYYSTGSNGGQYTSPFVAGYDNTAISGEPNPGHGLGDTGDEGGASTDFIRGIYLGESEFSAFNDFGENLGTIGDLVFSDPDQDGIFEPSDGEIGIPSVEVSLYHDDDGNGMYDGTEPLVKTVLTDVNGEYLFEDLAVDDGSGSYQYLVVVTDSTNVLDGALNTLGPDQSTNPSSDNNSKDETGFAVTLDPTNTEVLVADFGYYPLAALGDYVWNDLNENGVQDADEVGVTGITVNLYSTADLSTPVNTTITDGSGYYEFIDIAPGDYVVEFVPGVFSFTGQDSSLTTDVFDSDADVTTGRTATVSLLPGEFDKTVDAGLIYSEELAGLGDFIWYDVDNNGVQDGGESGVGGVTVNLLDGAGTLIASSLTDTSGYYEFTGLIPGDYQIEVVKPAGYDFAPQDNAGDDALDSDVDIATGRSSVVTLASGEFNETLDAGLFSAAGVASLGDYIWLDTNSNGQQDVGETGVPGIKLELYDSSDNLIATTTTDVDGMYLFDNLIPGDYYVKLIPPVGSDYTLTVQNIGSDSTDSDFNAISYESDVVTLASGDNNTSIDGGLVLPGLPASLGDYVWEDTNGDGLQDEVGTGLSGVLVELLDASGGVLASTTTDGSGFYSFTNLSAGEYLVRFNQPSGYVPTVQGSGIGAANDSDADEYTGVSFAVTLNAGDNNDTIDAGFTLPASLGDRVWLDLDRDGVQDAGETGISGVTVELYDSLGNLVLSDITDSSGFYLFEDLSPGDYSVLFVAPTDMLFSPEGAGSDASLDSDVNPATGETAVISLSGGENNLDIDAGLYFIPASLGDRVWLDLDRDGIQDAGEMGVSGVMVNLYDSLGDLVASVTTDSLGNYLFTNLTPGDYQVEFIAPEDYPEFTQSGAGSDQSADSDADVSTGRTVIISLSPGEENRSLDAGLLPGDNEPFIPSPGCGSVTDFDSDGIPDSLDADVDGDGIPNSVEGDADPDNDGLPNYRDVDADGDGLADIIEAQGSPLILVLPERADSNSDGIDDAYGSGLVPVDTDSDGVPDYLDTDSDGDGIDDILEIQDPNHFIPPSGTDSDCDGLDDVCDQVPGEDSICYQFDGDDSSVPDVVELPSDCSDVNLLPVQFNLDSTGARMYSAVRKSLKVRRVGSVLGSCESLSSDLNSKVSSKAADAYASLWQGVWSVPSEHYQCLLEAPRVSCTEYDIETNINEVSANAKLLYKLVYKVLKSCNQEKRIRRTIKRQKKLYQSIITELNDLPDPVVNCLD